MSYQLRVMNTNQEVD